MAKYKTILFDWDGTLAKTIPVWEESFKRVFNTLHMSIDIDAVTGKLWVDSSVLNEIGIEHEGFFDLVYEQLSQNYAKTPLYDGALDALKSLKKIGMGLALVTSTRRKYVLEALAFHQLEPLFEVVVASEDVELHKPDPQPYQKALSLLSEPKETSIIVGDSRFDLAGSKNAGLDCILFFPDDNKRYYNDNDLLTFEPTYVVKDYKELLKIL